MDLDLQKHKKAIAGLSDADLVARRRDPGATATQRMLIDSELSRRGIDSNQLRIAAKPEGARRSKPVSLIPIGIMIVIFASVGLGILEDLGFDVFEWLKKFFETR